MNASKTKAWIGAILVHIALLVVLFFSVRWKQVAPAAEEPLAVNLVSTVAAPVVVAAPAPPPKRAPAPTPAPAPEPPAPAPAPKPALKPAPLRPAPPSPPPPAVKAPAPTPAPAVKTPTPKPAAKAPVPPPAPSPADIAREKAQNEAVKKAQSAKLVADEAKQNVKLKANEDAAKKEAARKLDDARAKEIKLSQDKADKEQQTATAAAAATALAAEKQAKELAERQAAERAAKAATDAATARARAKAEGDYVSKIRAKVQGNIILAVDIAGNPEAVFDVMQLPTGEVLSVRLAKSSGNRAYDEAVERAINKSSPLPKPDRADVFQRQLSLKFRPLE